VYSYYGLWPFVVGGFFVALFAAYIAYSSHKNKHNPKPEPNSRPTLTAFQRATPEEREKLLELQGFTKYTDENGNTRWRPPAEGLPAWAKADGAMQIEMEKESPKIRCSYCGTVYDGKLDKCPNCGANRQGNEEQIQE